MIQYAVVVSRKNVPKSHGVKVLKEVFCNSKSKAIQEPKNLRHTYPTQNISIHKQIEF